MIVIEPLLFIDEEAIKHLRSLSFTATYIGCDINETTDIRNRQFTFLFTSAENILAVDQFRCMLSSGAHQERDVLLVQDETHTIVNWCVEAVYCILALLFG